MSVATGGGADPRRRRQSSWRRAAPLLAAAAVLLVFVAIGGGGWYLLHHDSSAGTPTCRPSRRPPRPVVAPVHVLNGTSRRGLARRTADELLARGFPVAAVGNTDKPVKGRPQVRYSRPATAAARALAAQVPDAKLVVDPRLRGRIELVLGTKFHQLKSRSAAPRRSAPATRRTPTPTGSPCR